MLVKRSYSMKENTGKLLLDSGKLVVGSIIIGGNQFSNNLPRTT